MLSANKVTVKIAQKTLLDNISLAIKPGELLAIIGPNGAGKSTLLKSLSAEIKLSSGIVTLNDKKISDWSLSKRAQLCAILPQNSSLSFPFSVLDVVLMGRSPHAKSNSTIPDLNIAHQALSLIGIKQLTERIYTTLSGGEKQRVHFARVLTQIWHPSSQPSYLMLDEPTSALDISCQHDCLKIAHDFAKQQNVGVLVVLHDLNLAALYADKIAVLHEGKLIEYGSPKAVINENLVQHIFDYSAKIYAHPENKDCPLIISKNQGWKTPNNQENQILEVLK